MRIKAKHAAAIRAGILAARSDSAYASETGVTRITPIPVELDSSLFNWAYMRIIMSQIEWHVRAIRKNLVDGGIIDEN